MTRGVPAVLAIDVGTTSAKAGLVGLDGTVLRLERTGYEISVGREPGSAEQDPEAWWSALVALSRRLVEGFAGEVIAIALDGHGPTLTAVDADGIPTRPAITWLDTRPTAALAELSAASGLRGWALGVLPAALWLERNEPAAAARSCWYLNSWEFLGMRLAGRPATTVVPGQSLPDASTLEQVGLPASKVAPTVPAGDVLGGLATESASVLGLPSGTPVVAGVVDAFASFHGAGLLAPGDAIDTGGMSGGFGVYANRPVEAAGSFCTPAPLAGRYVVGGAMAATGRALDWLRDDIFGGTVATDALIAQAARVAPGAEGIVFLPYLAGERSPIWDPDASGAFVGLALRHGRAHLTRAVLEAAALAIRHVAEPILAAGVSVREMRVCGGPARSADWNQIKADVTGFTVAVPHALETAVVGSAIVGAVGVAAYPDLSAAIAAMTRIDRRFEPRRELADVYDRVYRAYVELYPRLRDVLGSMDEQPHATVTIGAEARQTVGSAAAR